MCPTGARWAAATVVILDLLEPGLLAGCEESIELLIDRFLELGQILLLFIGRIEQDLSGQ